MIHELIQVAVTLQSIQLCGTPLPLDDNGAILPRVAIATLNIQFRIRDAVAAATRVLHFHALVANRAQALAVRHWPRNAHSGDWLGAAYVELRDELAGTGIDVIALDLAGLGIGVALKNINDWSYADDVTGARPK